MPAIQDKQWFDDDPSFRQHGLPGAGPEVAVPWPSDPEPGPDPGAEATYEDAYANLMQRIADHNATVLITTSAPRAVESLIAGWPPHPLLLDGGHSVFGWQYGDHLVQVYLTPETMAMNVVDAPPGYHLGIVQQFPGWMVTFQ